MATRLQALREPGWLALISILLAVVVLGVLRLPGDKPGDPAEQPSTGDPRPALPSGLESYVFLFAAIGLAGLLLAVVAFHQPVTDPAEAMVPYLQQGAFSYSAQGPASVYDQGRVTTGDPIFRALLDRFRIRFDYGLRTDAATAISGNYALLAEVQDANGWTRRVTLTPRTEFEGTTVAVEGEVRLDNIQAMIDQMRLKTGLQRAAFTLSVFPEIEVTGTVGGRPLETSFSPRLVFQLDDL